MERREASELLRRALGIEEPQPEVQRLCRLWGGMGDVLELRVAGRAPLIAKRIRMPGKCSSIGDRRKKDSYEVEARFYEGGHAERLLAAGCTLPKPLLVERKGDGQLTILMEKLDGRNSSMGDAEMRSMLTWLATCVAPLPRLHRA